VAQILIADDTAASRAAIELVVRRAGHSVTAVDNGDAAVSAVQSGAFDLVILDIWMPKKSGLEVLKLVRTLKPEQRVIMVSGGGPGATLEQATAMADIYRADRVLYKPFEDEELLDAVAAMLD
jgi:CheY-like chemotaxis protein